MKKVTCINCGFLCWDVSHIADEFSDSLRHDEMIEIWRNDSLDKIKSGIFEDGIHDENNKISCLRNQWTFGNPITEDKKYRYANMESIRTLRKCVYYVKYQPGFNPEEHKELKREADTTRTIRNATIIGAIIGAVAAIVAQLLYVIISNNG
jgi:hypothetical protein